MYTYSICKSTIFHIITGLKEPSYGKVLINGLDCTNIPIYERATKFNLGYVPQYGGFIQDLSLIDNLKLVAEIHIKEKNHFPFINSSKIEDWNTLLNYLQETKEIS